MRPKRRHRMSRQQFERYRWVPVVGGTIGICDWCGWRMAQHKIALEANDVMGYDELRQLSIIEWCHVATGDRRCPAIRFYGTHQLTAYALGWVATC